MDSTEQLVQRALEASVLLHQHLNHKPLVLCDLQLYRAYQPHVLILTDLVDYFSAMMGKYHNFLAHGDPILGNLEVFKFIEWQHQHQYTGEWNW